MKAAVYCGKGEVVLPGRSGSRNTRRGSPGENRHLRRLWNGFKENQRRLSRTAPHFRP